MPSSTELTSRTSKRARSLVSTDVAVPEKSASESPVATSALLERVLSQPTAPFREGWVRAEIRRILDENGIPHFSDKTGNLIAGVSSAKELKSEFRVAMMAHMDHPGFHLGPRIKGRQHRCFWFGGAPYRQMEGARVRVFDPLNKELSAQGTITKFETPLNRDEEGIPFLVEFERELKGYSEASFGAFDLEGFHLSDDVIRTRAADDLAGCVIALGALIDQERALREDENRAEAAAPRRRFSREKNPRRLLAVFTRAEEVGFIGCTDLLTRKILPENIWFLSLEASKALPEAEMGRGPVLRIGDAWCLFDAEFSSLLWTFAKELAASTEKSENPFRFQRRLMSGGVCEGTPLTIFGFQVAAISVPLLNYHNQGEDGPAQEMISLFDVEGARALCFSLAEKLKEKPDWKSKVKKEILGFHRKLKPHLKAQIPFDGEDLQ